MPLAEASDACADSRRKGVDEEQSARARLISNAFENACLCPAERVRCSRQGCRVEDEPKAGWLHVHRWPVRTCWPNACDDEDAAGSGPAGWPFEGLGLEREARPRDVRSPHGRAGLRDPGKADDRHRVQGVGCVAGGQVTCVSRLACSAVVDRYHAGVVESVIVTQRHAGRMKVAERGCDVNRPRRYGCGRSAKVFEDQLLAAREACVCSGPRAFRANADRACTGRIATRIRLTQRRAVRFSLNGSKGCTFLRVCALTLRQPEGCGCEPHSRSAPRCIQTTDAFFPGARRFTANNAVRPSSARQLIESIGDLLPRPRKIVCVGGIARHVRARVRPIDLARLGERYDGSVFRRSCGVRRDERAHARCHAYRRWHT